MAAPLAQSVGGANVEFVTVLDLSRARIRVIERGVGWTLACGTGSVATAAVLHREGLVGVEVTIENPGGDLMVRLDEDGARLAGPVQFVANVEWLQA
jgi:diaminopimelate epimerase